eukprot:scaffold135454_cov17-Tisochrysis_lutea.AAC.1
MICSALLWLLLQHQPGSFSLSRRRSTQTDAGAGYADLSDLRKGKVTNAPYRADANHVFFEGPL